MRVEQNPIANVLASDPDAEPERLGGNAGFAFYSYRSNTPDTQGE